MILQGWTVDMRCLILGASGQIGAQLLAACENRGLPRQGTWYAYPHSEHIPLDIRDSEAVDELLADYQPDVTFLAAGIACPGYSEAFPHECMDVIVGGAQIVADAVARRGGKLVSFSTDEIFGEYKAARREDDPLEPSGVFSQAHADAELIVRLVLPDRHLIVRTGYVYGPEARGRNFICRVTRKLAERLPVPVATDRYCQPTYGPDLATAVVELVSRNQTGTVHVVGPDRHTEFTFARLAAHILGYDVDLLDGQPESEIDDDRPARGRVWLDRYKLRELLGAQAIRGAAEGLRAMRAHLSPKSIPSLRAA